MESLPRTKKVYDFSKLFALGKIYCINGQGDGDIPRASDGADRPERSMDRKSEKRRNGQKILRESSTVHRRLYSRAEECVVKKKK